MAHSGPQQNFGRMAALFAALGLWAASVLAIGVIYRDEPWSIVCFGLGGACAVITAVGAWYGAWMGTLYGVLILTAAGVLTSGIVLGEQLTAVMGVVALVVIGATMPLAWLLADRAHAGSSSSAGPAQALPASSSHTLENLLAHIYENSMLSDTAKRVLFRDRELEMLRRAIEEDLARGDYNAGLTLCDDMANLFGHREEAEAYRNRILQAGHASYEAKVREALDQLDAILATRDWAAAHREAASIRRLFPTHHLVQDIDQRILEAREQHKQELEARFLAAAEREDVAQAMDLLKDLDRYLTREEAARIASVAQHVIAKHRETLSMQFKAAVGERQWAEAARLGDAIMTEFPNSKMADEVRSMIDVLRVRASQAAVLAEG